MYTFMKEGKVGYIKLVNFLFAFKTLRDLIQIPLQEVLVHQKLKFVVSFQICISFLPLNKNWEEHVWCEYSEWDSSYMRVNNDVKWWVSRWWQSYVSALEIRAVSHKNATKACLGKYFWSNLICRLIIMSSAAAPLPQPTCHTGIMGKECRGLSVPNADHIKAQEMAFWVKANARGTERDSVCVCYCESVAPDGDVVLGQIPPNKRWFDEVTSPERLMNKAATQNAPDPSVRECVCAFGWPWVIFHTGLKRLTFTFMILEGAFSQKWSQSVAYIDLRTICVRRAGDFQHNFPLSCFNFHLITHSLNL